MSNVLDLRCENALHGRLNPDRMILSVKCRKCSSDAHYPVYHHWPLREIVERYLRGDLNGVCAPEEERFVHWRVTAA